MQATDILFSLGGRLFSIMCLFICNELENVL